MPANAQTERIRRSAREMMDTVLDPGSFRSWDIPADYSDQEPGYHAELLAAAERSGVDESVITGEGSINGRRVAIIVNEFSFLGGSIGRFAADRLVQAFERATTERLPVLASPASGGTRMQEGTPAFVGMVKIAAAVRAHRATRQPYLVYLRHPTTGGVMASWGSLGHITVAEPGALLGFLGPRVYEAIYGEPFPTGVQVAENLHRLGLIDALVPVEELAGVLTRALEILSHGSESRAPAESEDTAPPTAGPEDRVLGRDEVWASIMATATRADPRCGTSSSTEQRMFCSSRAPAVANATHAPTWRWPGSGIRPAFLWVRTGLPETPNRWGPRFFARPNAAWHWPNRWASRWSASSTRRARHFPGRPRRVAWPRKSPAPLPGCRVAVMAFAQRPLR